MTYNAPPCDAERPAVHARRAPQVMPLFAKDHGPAFTALWALLATMLAIIRSEAAREPGSMGACGSPCACRACPLPPRSEAVGFRAALRRAMVKQASTLRRLW